MPEITVVYWRDIPAQVIVGRGRRAKKIQLSERFEKAIDRCAMRFGAKDTDSYLSEWRKSTATFVDGEASDLAQAEARRLEAEFNDERLNRLVSSGGWN